MILWCTLPLWPVPTKIRCMWVCEFLYAILRMSVQNSCLFGCDECTCLHFCGDVLIVFPITNITEEFFLCSQLHVSSIQYRRAKHTRCILYTLYFLAQIHPLHNQMSDIYPLHGCNLSLVFIQIMLWSKRKFWCSCLIYASALTGYIGLDVFFLCVPAMQCTLCTTKST